MLFLKVVEDDHWVRNAVYSVPTPRLLHFFHGANKDT